jgi:hypothetical protein
MRASQFINENVDSDAVNELDSFIQNDEDLYRRRFMPIISNIKSIEIDEIDLGALVYEGTYTPDYPEPWATQQRESGADLQESFKNVTRMGHNGTWQFKFTSPFYMWLLENLY